MIGVHANDMQTAAGTWLFSQPAAITIAVLAAGAAMYGLYSFAKLHERTMTAATSDMKAGLSEIAAAFTRDQERDKDLFLQEQEKNRELIRDVMKHQVRTNRSESDRRGPA